MPTIEELKLLQSLPLELKVAKTKARIREFVQHYGEYNVAVAFAKKTAGRLTVNAPSAIITTARLMATKVAGSKKYSRTTHIFI